MQGRKKLLWIGAAVASVALWYLFRPELLFVDHTVSESFPGQAMAASSSPDRSQSVVEGRFHSVAHETTGVATIHQLGSGTRLLRLTQFKTSNGPDLRVYAVAAGDALDNDDVTNAGFVEIAKLKGNEGDQNYELPADLDLKKYRAITIWCRRFGVNFATAPLGTVQS